MDKLSNLRVPKGTLRIEIDDPDQGTIEKPVGIIRGWFATADVEIPDEFHFQIGGVILPHVTTQRVDVEAALPDYKIQGFNIAYDLMPFLPNIANNRLVIRLVLSGYDSHDLRFRIDDRALAICLAAASEQ